MKYLLWNWDNFDNLPNDPTTITDEEFESMAKKDGHVYESPDDFESAFNAELFGTATHQLRIIS